MSGSVNKVMLMGNITRDIELKYTASNKAVANFGLALNAKFKANDGTMKDETTFVDCQAWGLTAETMSKYLTKGRPVFVEGRLKLETWDDKQSGQKRSKLMVVVDKFTFVGGRDEGAGTSPSPSAGRQQAIPAAAQTAYEPIDVDGIPF